MPTSWSVWCVGSQIEWVLWFCPLVGRPVSAVVQRPLQPLDGGRLQRVAQQRHQVAGQAAAALRPHGVPLIGHGTGTWNTTQNRQI